MKNLSNFNSFVHSLNEEVQGAWRHGFIEPFGELDLQNISAIRIRSHRRHAMTGVFSQIITRQLG